ncbi:MAG TPA: DUF4190 domain-containing protein [Clostridiales bacterium]|nr:DUF4190 domain-containing protein [Clostridiales bacterium]
MASLVLGIISFLSICLPILPLLTAIIGLILGIMSLVKGNGGKGMAIAGVILSGLSLIFGLLIFVGLAAFLSDEGIMSEIRNGIGYEYNYDMWDSFY